MSAYQPTSYPTRVRSSRPTRGGASTAIEPYPYESNKRTPFSGYNQTPYCRNSAYGGDLLTRLSRAGVRQEATGVDGAPFSISQPVLDLIARQTGRSESDARAALMHTNGSLLPAMRYLRENGGFVGPGVRFQGYSTGYGNGGAGRFNSATASQEYAAERERAAGIASRRAGRGYPGSAVAGAEKGVTGGISGVQSGVAGVEQGVGSGISGAERGLAGDAAGVQNGVAGDVANLKSGAAGAVGGAEQQAAGAVGGVQQGVAQQEEGFFSKVEHALGFGN